MTSSANGILDCENYKWEEKLFPMQMFKHFGRDIDAKPKTYT